MNIVKWENQETMKLIALWKCRSAQILIIHFYRLSVVLVRHHLFCFVSIMHNISSIYSFTIFHFTFFFYTYNVHVYPIKNSCFQLSLRIKQTFSLLELCNYVQVFPLFHYWSTFRHWWYDFLAKPGLTQMDNKRLQQHFLIVSKLLS